MSKPVAKSKPKKSERSRTRLVWEIEILQKIADLTSAELELSAVLRNVVRIAAEAAEADSVFIYLLNEKRDALVLRASQTPHPKELENVSLKVGEGITGWVARENKPVAIDEEAYLDPRFKTFDILPEDRYEGFLSVPIVYKNRPIGVINVQHHSPHEYTKEMVALMVAIANQVGGVIENARLYEETKRKARQLDSLVKVSETITSEKYLDEILNLIVVMTAELFNSRHCSMMLLDDKGSSLIVRATESLSEGYQGAPSLKVNGSLSGEVIASKRIRVIADVKKEPKYALREVALRENLTSMILVPMVIKDKAIGIINVYTEEYHDFTREEKNALQMIANQAAVAIENTKLMEETLKIKEAMETKKLVERAQEVLIRTQKVSADAAYRLIHKKSMDSCRPMKAIAEAIILAADLGSSQI